MLAKRLLLFLVLPALASMAFICDSGGSGSSGSDQGIKIEITAPGGASLTPGAPAVTQGPPPTPGQPVSADEIANLSGNFGKVKSFKATISQSGGTAALTGVIEYQQPDRVHVTIGSGATAQEIICIGTDFYVKQGATPWQKVPAGGTNCRGNLGPADPKALADGINTAAADKSLTKGGQDTVGGTKCQVYSQSMPGGSSFEMCVANGLPLRLVSKGPGQSVTITFSDIDKNIEIKAPL